MRKWKSFFRKKPNKKIGIKKVVYPNYKPICPHCSKSLDNILLIENFGSENHNVYFCPHCHKIVGMGYDFS